MSSTSPLDWCTMGNQQRTPPRCAPQTSKLNRLLCLNFENYTVVAFALVAEYWQTRPAQNRVPNGHAGSNPAERTQEIVVSTRP